MVKFLFFIILILLTSCFPLTSNGLKNIKINDNETEVFKKIGKPFSKKAYYNKTYWVYYVHDDLFSIFSNFRKFPFIGFYPFLRTGEEYWIIIEDNRVVAWGLSKNFGNNLPRALSSSGGTLEVTKF